MINRTDEEIQLRKEIDEVIESLKTTLKQMPREQVAYLVIKRFMELRDPSDELRAKFLEWLDLPHGIEAKEKAFEKYLEEVFEREDPAPVEVLRAQAARQTLKTSRIGAATVCEISDTKNAKETRT